MSAGGRGYASGMRTGQLKPLYARLDEPFVTIWGDTTNVDPDAPRETGLRWQALMSEVAAQGAEADELEPLRTVVGPAPVGGEQSQMLVGQGGRVLLNEHLPVQPALPVARRGSLPHLLPWLVARSQRMPYLLVLIDRIGADVSVRDLLFGEAERIRQDGKDHPITKVATGGWAQPRYHRRTENLWDRNAGEVADTVDRLRREHRPAMVVVAGDVRSRVALLDKLPEATRDLVVHVDGGRAAGVSEEALERDVAAAVDGRYAEAVEAVAARYEQERGRGGLATGGVEATTAALADGRVGTLLVDQPELPGDAPREPDQVGHERADAVMVRSLAMTDGDIVAVPASRLDLAEHVGAILRY